MKTEVAGFDTITTTYNRSSDFLWGVDNKEVICDHIKTLLYNNLFLNALNYYNKRQTLNVKTEHYNIKEGGGMIVNETTIHQRLTSNQFDVNPSSFGTDRFAPHLSSPLIISKQFCK